jgi:hypothetical protein
MSRVFKHPPSKLISNGYPQKNTVTDIALKATGLAAPAFLLAAAMYEWAFLYGLGLDFSKVPVQIADLSRTAFLFLIPFSLIAVFVVAAYLSFRHFTDWEQLTVRVRKKGDDIADVLALCTGGIGLFSWMLFGDVSAHGATSITILWSTFAVLILTRNAAQRKVKLFERMLWIFIPFAILTCFAHGYTSGRSKLVSNEANAAVTAKWAGTSEQVTKAVTILRTYDKGLLIKWNGPTLTFVKYEDVNRIDYDQHRATWQGLICMFGWKQTGCAG